MVKVICDGCRKECKTIWGTFEYSPGGGILGIETFHFCFYCVPNLRSKLVEIVEQETAPNGRWMIFEDHNKSKGV